MTEEKKAPKEEKKTEPKKEAPKKEEPKPEVKQEKPKEKPKEEPKKKETKPVKVPKKFQDLVKQIESLSVLELSELVKILEEKFGVSAAAMTVATASAAGAGPAEGGAPAEEKTAFNVELTSAGGSKIQVIKAVKEITGKGLKEAKDLVDAAPKVIKENVDKPTAEEIKKKLEEAGATVELK